MKIISWNCNMAFRKKYAPIIAASPDVLILQECEHRAKLDIALTDTDYREIIWYGENPHKGIAAITFNNWTIESLDMHDPEYQYILPLRLSNGVEHYNLFVIWAMPHKTERSKDYVGQIFGAIHYYAELLDGPSILIGDFNSNAIFDKKRKKNNHQSVVKFLEEKQISSIYHLKGDYAHGEEPDPTLYLLKKLHKPYHMDYCFASAGLISESTTITIGHPQEWLSLSDHMPVIINNLG